MSFEVEVLFSVGGWNSCGYGTLTLIGAMMAATDHNIRSSYREMLLEHLFAGARGAPDALMSRIHRGIVFKDVGNYFTLVSPGDFHCLHSGVVV